MAHGGTLSNFPKLDDFLRFRKLVWGLRENREIREKGAEVGFWWFGRLEGKNSME